MSDQTRSTTTAGAPAPRFGLGCSRLGSITATEGSSAEELLDTAVAVGIDLLDTADIYGQGESERHIGQYLRAHGKSFIVASKVGQYYPWYFRPAFMVKSLIRKVLPKGMNSALRSVRGKLLPQDFSAVHIRRKVAATRERLGLETIDILFLHSPSAEILRVGEAVATLVTLKQKGAIGRVGTSCDDLAAFEAALDDPRIEAVQVTLELLGAIKPERVTAARARGTIVVAREIFGGVRPAGSPPMSHEEASRHLAVAEATYNVDVVLIGTTNHRRLRRLFEDRRAASEALTDA